MDSITATNAVSLNCDIELANKYLSLTAKHYTHSSSNDKQINKYELLSKSCQDRINSVFNIAIDLISYLMNLCASFGWQSAHTIYCVKFIRLNQRALIDHLRSIQLLKYIKSIGVDVARNATQLIMRKSFIDSNMCNNNLIYETKEIVNDSNTSVDNTDVDNVSLEILWEPQRGEKITADIVFIHGLHGSSDSTWKQGEWEHTSQNAKDNCVEIMHHGQMIDSMSDTQRHFTINPDDNSNSSLTDTVKKSISQCWPKDWLPLDFPTSRICAINYETDPYLWRPIWYSSQKSSSLAMRAMKMIRILVEHSVGVNRPIIWVGHSKGGLYIKQIIVNAHECGNAHWLVQSSRAVLFYSVPHRGSPLAELNLPFLTRSIEMIEIQKNFPTIMDLHRRFIAMCRNGILKMDIFSFIEMKFTELSVFYLRIIGVDSGDPGIGGVCKVQLDHLDVCKPRHRGCFLYRQLANMIKNAMNTHIVQFQRDDFKGHS